MTDLLPSESSFNTVSSDSSQIDAFAPPALEVLYLKGNTYIGWTEETTARFQLWWDGTTWSSDNKQAEHPINIHWTSKIRTSPVWQSFVQVARVKDGLPKVMCRGCDELLVHPQLKGTGTSSMKKHASKSQNCSKRQSSGNPPLDQSQLTFRAHKKHIAYVLELVKPFAKYTNALGKTNGTTIHNVFPVYDELFNHLDDHITKLERKREVWKQSMVPALQASMNKLAKYYEATYNTNDQIYSIATILNPKHKLTLFEAASWKPCWKDFYRTQFENYFVTKYKSGQRSPPVPLKELGRVFLTNAAANELTLVVRNNRKRKLHLQNEQREIAAYLEENMH
ncbi:MAG: hypothetical protein M1837_001842 [Sclerophora amabilis]|nr:MAG: hypothetical protein M1837_001842 [Sclerophora amabilis]